ncbi:MAG: winged helix-turn-helix domain-containing protein [Candidatus Methanomethyliaceae archaeon]|nr:winged helix-turn-helix domain-containing protein [Candidatus Methanomethyliaceae archaeon]MDW7971212.1 winged helix-turn-helix domain-containing protein [Nitrososphaerota archaeon]
MSIEEVFSSRGRVKILRILSERGEINISAIAKKAGLNHSTTHSHLKKLCEMGIVEEKRFGKIRIFRLRKEDPKGLAIINLFNVFKEVERIGR